MRRIPDSKESVQTHVLLESYGTLQSIVMLEGVGQ